MFMLSVLLIGQCNAKINSRINLEKSYWPDWTMGIFGIYSKWHRNESSNYWCAGHNEWSHLNLILVVHLVKDYFARRRTLTNGDLSAMDATPLAEVVIKILENKRSWNQFELFWKITMKLKTKKTVHQ